MKKMLLATALALLITGCAQQTFTVQNKPSAAMLTKTITVDDCSGWAKNSTSQASGAKVLLKTGLLT